MNVKPHQNHAYKQRQASDRWWLVSLLIAALLLAAACLAFVDYEHHKARASHIARDIH